MPAKLSKYIIPVFGLDKAGKSTLFKRLENDISCPPAPTVGFHPHKIQLRRTRSVKGNSRRNCCYDWVLWDEMDDLIMYDVGGGPKIRGIWKNYTAEAHGFIFVVNSAEPERYPEFIKEIGKLIDMDDERCLRDKPILIMFNLTGATAPADESNRTDLLKQLEKSGWPFDIIANQDSDHLKNLQKNTIIIRNVRLVGHQIKKHRKRKPGKNKVMPTGGLSEEYPIETEETIDPRINESINRLLDLIDVHMTDINEYRHAQMEKLDQRYKRDLADRKIKFEDAKSKLAEKEKQDATTTIPQTPVMKTAELKN